MATYRVIIYRPVVNQFRGWTGPVGQSTLRLARMARNRQVGLVGKKSGRLANSISVGARTYWARGIQTTVGANAGQRTRGGYGGYAVMQEEGTLPHLIYPKKPGGQLIFYWAKVGQVVHLNGVSHPGNKAYHWAMRGMAAAMATWKRS